MHFLLYEKLVIIAPFVNKVNSLYVEVDSFLVICNYNRKESTILFYLRNFKESKMGFREIFLKPKNSLWFKEFEGPSKRMKNIWFEA